MERDNHPIIHPHPHVVLLPFPAQGHVKPMFKLAQLLCHAGCTVTFATSDYAHDALVKSINLEDFLVRFPGFRFKSLPPEPSLPFPPNERPSIVASLIEVFSGARILARKKGFRELMMALGKEAVPPTCIIADGIMSFAIDVAEELAIPAITFRTYSASCTWVYFHIHKLVQQGDIPFPDEDMDRPITAVTGLESLLRRRDLPSICRVKQIDDPLLEFYLTQTSSMTRASGLILNTFQELEEAAISGLGSIFPNKKIYTIGPLHALLRERLDHNVTPSSDGSLLEQDRSCMAWLDCQPSGSVVYVSFGSLVRLTPAQFMEFWHGLINSGVPFLWVIRPDLIDGEVDMGQKAGLLEETNSNGMIVGWAPQEEVLAHPSTGGFLTHGGWNSTLESIFAGVPLIGWPQLADQQVNTRCISDMWRVGIDMKDTCHRSTVKRVVRDLMQNNKEFARRSEEMAKLARRSIAKSGSSNLNLDRLIDDIRAIRL